MVILKIQMIAMMQSAFDESSRKLFVWKRWSGLWHTPLYAWVRLWSYRPEFFYGDMTFCEHPLRPLSLFVTIWYTPSPPSPVMSFVNSLFKDHALFFVFSKLVMLHIKKLLIWKKGRSSSVGSKMFRNDSVWNHCFADV